VVIGENCRLEHCYIGPYSSIADRVTLVEADLEHSVVLEDAQVIGVHQRIVDSLIGQRVRLTEAPRRPHALRFMVGDDSQVELTP
jgi:glucose-1-phosphate thymidylyltransferase